MSRVLRYAPKAAPFLIAGEADTLPKSRRLVLNAPLQGSDGGEQGNFTVDVGPATSEARGVVKLAGQLGGQADAPDVRGLRVAKGTDPETYALLDVGVVRDGELVVRDGDTLTSTPVPEVVGTDDLDMGSHRIVNLASGVAPSDAATYGQVQSLINGLDWQASVLDRDLTAPPSSPAPQAGDRHLVASGASGAWAGHDLEIATFDGSQWAFTIPNQGMTVHVEDEGVDYWFDGAAWLNLGTSVDHNSLLNLGTGNPHPQYQLAAELAPQFGQPNGYAPLGGDGALPSPATRLRTIADPASPVPGEMWVSGPELRFRDNNGTPASHSVVPADRQVATTGGLTGGGMLTQNRTLSIAAYTGFVSKDVDPASQEYGANATVDVLVVDVGTEGQLIASALRLPATVDASLSTLAQLELSDGSSRTVENTSTATPLDRVGQALVDVLMGGLAADGVGNGLRLQRVRFQVKNNTGSPVTADIGPFRLRAYATPRGAGAAL